MAGVTVVPISGGAPAVQVTIDGGATITAVTLKRTAGGATDLARIQPATGHPTASVQDYEIPWDADVTYTAAVTTGSGTTSYTSTAVRVSASAAWAIHPAYPQRSVTIDQQHPTVSTGICVVAVNTVTRPAVSTEHRIYGSAFPVVTTFGSRQSARGGIVLTTSTLSDSAALDQLLDDQTPILIRFPAAFGVGWEDGFYSIGDVTVDRPGLAADPRRTYTLPFTRVRPPAVTTQSGWDYPTITETFADYQSITDTFADYPALSENRRT